MKTSQHWDAYERCNSTPNRARVSASPGGDDLAGEAKVLSSQNGREGKEIYLETVMPSVEGVSSSRAASDNEEGLGKRETLRKLADEMFQVKSSGQFEVDYLGESTKGDLNVRSDFIIESFGKGFFYSLMFSASLEL